MRFAHACMRKAHERGRKKKPLHKKAKKKPYIVTQRVTMVARRATIMHTTFYTFFEKSEKGEYGISCTYYTSKEGMSLLRFFWPIILHFPTRTIA